ncbi:MAG: hypothetical protein IKS31_04145 [Clostridia bacterium]|nr:hypothetical protein [Clostridia bacterium]
MTLHEEQEKVQSAMKTALSGLQEDPWLTQRVLANAKGEEPVVKKLSATVIIVIALLAITAVALAAGSLIFGWVDFYKGWYNVDVPDAARLIMTNTDQDTVTLGPVTFTVREKYCDPWTALTSTVVTLNDGTKALLTGNDPFDPIRANGENGIAAAQRLGVDPALTWAEAARQLDLPLYSVRAVLEVPEELNEDGWMEDMMFNEDGSVTCFCMPLLNGTASGDHVDGQLFLRVQEVNVDDPENQPEALSTRCPIRIALQLPSETQTYEVHQEYPAAGLTLTSVRAELTPAGVYLFANLTAHEGLTRDDYAESGQWVPVLYSADGKPYGGGLNLTVYEDMDDWPQLMLMRLHSMDSIPDTMIFALEDDNGSLQVPQVILNK